ncbi:MAG: diguanylate cyclase domain-containing protein, partial [Gammaproteobacteria bacterium]
MTRKGAHTLLQLAVSATVGSGLIAGATYLMSLQRHALRADLRDQTVQHAAAVRAKIESELSATVFLTQGLVAYINAQGPMNEAGIRRALAALYTAGRHIRNIAVAPDNRVRFVYPRAGNEPAIGLDYERTPDQWPAVQRAIETRAPVLAGPVALVQGGEALINRTPVFVNGNEYWGIVSVVIDLQSFLRATGVQDVEQRVRLALRGRDALGERGGLIAGDPEVFDEHPLVMTLAVPGGTWELAAVPLQGWDSVSPFVTALPFFAYGTSVLLSLLLWLALRERSSARDARAAMQQLISQLAAANHELEQLSETDALTGIPNRRGLDEALMMEWRRCRRHDEALSLLMIDIDMFKPYNDAHGHLKGDQCLREVATVMQSTAQRAGEFLARSGGEEFVMVLPGMDADGAAAQAERVRAAVEEARIEHGSSPVSPWVTVSVGVATRPPHSLISLDALREAADSALYAAKRTG